MESIIIFVIIRLVLFVFEKGFVSNADPMIVIINQAILNNQEGKYGVKSASMTANPILLFILFSLCYDFRFVSGSALTVSVDIVKNLSRNAPVKSRKMAIPSKP